MSQAVLLAMLAYINDLQRSIDLHETFADDVVAQSNAINAEQSDGCAQGEMLDLARRHRVGAIKARAKMEAMTEQFVRCFGLERLEQEQSTYPARPGARTENRNE